MNPVVRLTGLRHRYGAVLAADGLDLEIPAGHMVGFIGPDGVGKSTWLGLIAGALLMIATGNDAMEGYEFLFKGGLMNLERIGNTLATATPLILTGLSVAFAFRTGLFNIGTPGQVLIGGVLATVVGLLVDVPKPLLLMLTTMAAIAGGALWGVIPGLLKARFNVHEVVSGIMMNWIAYWITYYMVPAYFKGSYVSPESDATDERNQKELNFSLDEARVIAEINPQMLSLRELYTVAISYKNTPEQFYKIIDISVKIYPASPVANLNAAAAAIERGNTQAAGRYLQMASHETLAYKNCRGAYELLCNNTYEGIRLLKAAKAEGSEEATYNLKIFFESNQTNIQ